MVRRRAGTVTGEVVIRRPVHVVYGFYRNFTNMPRFLGDVVAVEQVADTTYRWIVTGPLGTRVPMRITITEQRVDQLIRYETGGPTPLRGRWELTFTVDTAWQICPACRADQHVYRRNSPVSTARRCRRSISRTDDRHRAMRVVRDDRTNAAEQQLNPDIVAGRAYDEQIGVARSVYQQCCRVADWDRHLDRRQRSQAEVRAEPGKRGVDALARRGHILLGWVDVDR
jgi:hypothetical protein